MKKTKKIPKKLTIVLIDGGSLAPEGKQYRVEKLWNSVEFRIGERLSMGQAKELCTRENWIVKVKGR